MVYEIFLEHAQKFGPENLEVKHLLPYIPLIKKNSSSNVSLDIQKFVRVIDSDELWCPEQKLPYDKWVASLVSTLLGTFTEKCSLDMLVPVCEVKVSKNR